MKSNLYIFKLLLLTSLTFSATILIAQNPPPPPPPPVAGGIGDGGRFSTRPGNKTPGATVRGRLVYEDTGAPIRFAEIAFTPVGSMGAYQESGKTDENGEFVVNEVLPGEYYPFVKDRGVLNPTVFYSPLDSESAREAKLSANIQKFVIPSPGDYHFLVRARRGALITGTVRYPDGEPAVGVEVEAMQIIGETPYKIGIAGPEKTGSGETDDQGFYRFSGLPEGSYFIRVTENVPHSNRNSKNDGSTNYDPQVRSIRGEGILQTWYPSSVSHSQASAVNAYYGQQTEGINITLPDRKLYDLSGVVIRRKTGEPLKNFRVTIYPLEDDAKGDLVQASLTRLTASKRFGYVGSAEREIPAEWSIASLPKGRYLLTASPLRIYDPGEAPDRGAIDNHSKYPLVTKEIELTDRSLDNVNFEIPEGASIKGIAVTEDGRKIAAYRWLIAVNKNSNEFERSMLVTPDKNTNANAPATFRFGRIAAGSYEFAYAGNEFYIRSVAVDDKPVEGNTVEIRDDEDLENVRVVLASDLAVIKGKITNFVEGTKVFVLLLKESQDIMTATFSGATMSGSINPGGTFEFMAAPGKYSVLVVSRNEERQTEIDLIRWINEIRKNAPVINVSAKEVISLELPMPE